MKMILKAERGDWRVKMTSDHLGEGTTALFRRSFSGTVLFEIFVCLWCLQAFAAYTGGGSQDGAGLGCSGRQAPTLQHFARPMLHTAALLTICFRKGMGSLAPP